MKTPKQKAKKLRHLQHTKRVIAKRLKIIKKCWRMSYKGYEESHPWEDTPNRLGKDNLNCGCKMCQMKGPDPHKLRDEDRLKDEVKNIKL